MNNKLVLALIAQKLLKYLYKQKSCQLRVPNTSSAILEFNFIFAL